MDPPASTPEPSAMIGLAGLVGLYAGKRKLQKGTESEA
ncbi:MAG: PEP-CTERM sorting domain-containing protein [Cyanobacteria bacterium P01_H01_bin.130]